MANTLPTFPIAGTSGQWVGTKFTPRFGRKVRNASNGDTRVRLLQSTPKYDMQVFYGHITQAQRDVLEQFYLNNFDQPVLFTPEEDGIQRTYLFGETPYEMSYNANGGYSATVFLIEA